jgi:CheY-like chemotaxis protein
VPLRIVALTANALEGDRQRSLDAGMDDHLAKPFGETELALVLQRHLGGG